MAEGSLDKQLRSHVNVLAGEIGERNVFTPEALREAEEYIRAHFDGLGYAVTAQPVPAMGVTSSNLEAALPGTERGGEVIMLGAHYDTVAGCPGADDNASAVAALLELARLNAGAAFRRSVRFVAFTNEEPPFFHTESQGSRVYAEAAHARGDDIRLMVSLEMLGCYRDEPGSQGYPPGFGWFYPSRGDFIALVSNLRSRPQMLRFARAFRDAASFPLEHAATFSFVPGVAWSDHLSFWKCGYRALMVTDTAFFRNPHYHMASDTPDTLDYRRMAAVTTGLSGAIRRLADAHRV